MESVPNTVYLACGSGNIASIQEKATKLGIADRIFFEGFVDTKLYSFILDIFLDTFPQIQGESAREAHMWGAIPLIRKWVDGSQIAINDSMVQMRDEYLKLAAKVRSGFVLDSSDIFNLTVLSSRICIDTEDYVDQVCLLSSNKQILESVKSVIREKEKVLLMGDRSLNVQTFLLIMDSLCH